MSVHPWMLTKRGCSPEVNVCLSRDVYRYFSFHSRVDVLSEPFDAITQALLERQGRRRLVGFMGAAAVASASRGTGAIMS